MDKLLVLSVGDSTHLGFGKGRIYYAGMPSEKAYSIVQKKGGIPVYGICLESVLSQRAKQNKNSGSQYPGRERYSR